MRNFTWGDTVQVKAGAIPENFTSSPLIASVCGIREVKNENQSHQFDAPIGSKIYLVEFGDGKSLELAEQWIEPLAP